MVAVSPQPGYSIDFDPIPKETLMGLVAGLPGYTEARYEKYYLRSPEGEPLLAVLREKENGEPIGMAALFPVELRVGGATLRGAIAGDLVIETAHRTLGPALVLQRHLLSALPEHGLDFVLAAPNAAAEPVFARSDYTVIGSQARFAKILRSHRLLASRLPEKIARPASWLADPLLRAASVLAPRVKTGRYSVERPERFDERFEEIWRLTAVAAAERGEALAARSARLLNWRYELDSEPPQGKPSRFHIFALQRAESVFAYLVYERAEGVLHVYEALWSEAPGALFSELVKVAEPRASVIVLSCFAPSGELARTLRRCGFVQRRGETSLYLHIAPSAIRARSLLENAGWHFLQGDLDL